MGIVWLVAAAQGLVAIPSEIPFEATSLPIPVVADQDSGIDGQSRELAAYSTYHVCCAGSAVANGEYIYNGTASDPYVFRKAGTNFKLKRYASTEATGKFSRFSLSIDYR